MKLTGKKQLLLLLATLLLLNATVLAAYLLVRIEGPPLQVLPEKVSGVMQYSKENVTMAAWNLTANITFGESWVTRLNITELSGNVSVEIFWFIEKQNLTVWLPLTNINVTTNLNLTGVGQLVYASYDGTIASNMDWAALVSDAGTYRVVAEISKK